MCGIAGIAGFGERPIVLDEIERMCQALYHRGPDEDGFYLSPDAGMGMRRLSIIDLKSGRQPVANEDGSIWVVFNGEIYNFQTLRDELESLGHRFTTRTDTEVIVHAYEQYGTACVDHFRGMFAFAIWDERRRQLMLARDRLGIKPLFYTSIGGRLIFASELKAILELPEVERKLDWHSVSHLFSFLTTPNDASIVAGVRKLPPGHILTCSADGVPLVHRYWDVEFRPDDSLSEDAVVEKLRYLLDESVRLRLISDVPVGAFLSGGIDSSAVVATMARQASGRVKTFSIGFEDAEYDESKWARMVARRFNTDHYEWTLDPNALDVVDDIAGYLDEPFGDSSAIPTYMVSKLASQHVKVVLSGDGGDELFAGYDKYLVEGNERRLRLPNLLRNLAGHVAEWIPDGARGSNFLRHMALSGPARYIDSHTLFRAHQQRSLFTADAGQCMWDWDPSASKVNDLARSSGNWLSSIQNHDLKGYLPLDILTKVDRMSMAHSIEARVPLLDHKLVEFAVTIPPEMLLRNGETKHIFKRAMRGILPDAIIDRPKRGFAVPLGRWFRGKLDDFVRNLLLSDTCRQRGILNPAYVDKLIRMHHQGRDLDLHLWTLISFELWCRRFLDRGIAPQAERSRSRVVLRRRAQVLAS